MIYLISACLLGTPCRYDGQSKGPSAGIRDLLREDTLIPVCPEILGGLPTPRPPAERQADGSVRTADGKDLSAAYRRGAEEVLRLARLFRADGVILKDKSPSCGTDGIYDGSFSKKLRSGMGVTAQLLRAAGIPLYSEKHLPTKKSPGGGCNPS